MDEKIKIILESLKEAYPALKGELEANPHKLEEVVASWPFRIIWKRKVYTWDDLTPDQKTIITEDYYPEVELLYAKVKRLHKVYRNKPNSITDFQNAVKDHLKRRKKIYPSIKPKYLDNEELFGWPKQKKDRYFCGKLLQHIVKELTGYTLDAAKLFKKGQK